MTHALSGLRPARQSRGIDASVCAAAIGVNVNTYHRYEAGTRRLYWDKAVLLANVIGCSLDDLARPAAAGTVVLERQLADWDTELPEGLVIPEVTEVLRLEAPAVPPPPPRVLPEVLEVPGA